MIAAADSLERVGILAIDHDAARRQLAEIIAARAVELHRARAHLRQVEPAPAPVVVPPLREEPRP